MNQHVLIIITAISLTVQQAHASWFRKLWPFSDHTPAHCIATSEHHAEFTYGETVIELRNHQNILDPNLPLGALVNAANQECLGGGGIDGAISKAGGPALYHAREALPVVDDIRCPTGQARLTISGAIKNTPFVIHAVGPRCASKESLSPQEKHLLVDAYINSLELINDWNKGDSANHPEFNAITRNNLIDSVAFPAISAGIFNCNVTLAAAPVAQAVVEWLNSHPTSGLKRVYFVFYNPIDPTDATLGFDAYYQAFSLINP